MKTIIFISGLLCSLLLFSCKESTITPYTPADEKTELLTGTDWMLIPNSGSPTMKFRYHRDGSATITELSDSSTGIMGWRFEEDGKKLSWITGLGGAETVETSEILRLTKTELRLKNTSGEMNFVAGNQ